MAVLAELDHRAHVEADEAAHEAAPAIQRLYGGGIGARAANAVGLPGDGQPVAPCAGAVVAGGRAVGSHARAFSDGVGEFAVAGPQAQRGFAIRAGEGDGCGARGAVGRGGIRAGDAAHQVSPFGARGANSGLQDTDNLIWKLKLILDGKAPESLLETYDAERIHGADENIMNSSRSTDFITPKSEISRVFRDAVLDLSERYEFARPLVNSGRLSVPCTYDGSPLNGPDCQTMPRRTRPGSPAVDVPLDQGAWLLDRLDGQFHILAIDAEVPDSLCEHGICATSICLSAAGNDALRERYLGDASSAVYLIRPDQHVAARWETFDEAAMREAINRASGRI